MRLIWLVLALSLVLAPVGTEAQQTAKVYTIGVLEPFSASGNGANLDAFRQGLREPGYANALGLTIPQSILVRAGEIIQ